MRCPECQEWITLDPKHGTYPMSGGIESMHEDAATDVQVGGNHYKYFAIQPAEFITRNGMGFLEGNVIKYVCRHQKKNGRQDIEKAIHYLQLILQFQYPTLPLPTNVAAILERLDERDEA